MKKTFYVLSAVVLLFSGCQKKDSSASVANSVSSGAKTGISDYSKVKPDVKLRLSHQMAASHSINKTALYFAEQVQELSKGKIHVDVFEAATLGSESQNLEALRQGSLDMAIIAVEFYTNIVSDVGALVLPYIYNSYDNEQEILKGEAGKLAADQIREKCDVDVLAYYVLAFRQIFTRSKPITKVEDLKGLKIRVPESKLYVNTFSLLGAAPTPVAWGETYTALDTGVVGGLENTPESILSASMNEVTKYINITNHISAPTTFSISHKVYAKLSSEQQEILKEAAKKASEYGLKLTEENDSIAREKLQTNMEVIKTDIDSMKKKINYFSFDTMKTDTAKKILELVQSSSK